MTDDRDEKTTDPKTTDEALIADDDAKRALVPLPTARGLVAFDRAERAYALRLSGMSYAKIGEAMGLSHSTVFELIRKRLRRVAGALANTTVKEHLAIELERLDAMFLSCWARAVGGPIIDPNTHEPVPMDEDDPTAGVKHYEPDPRFLLRAQEILKQRADLILPAKAQRIEVTGEGGGPVKSVTLNLEVLTPAQIATLEILLERAGLKALPNEGGAPLLPPSTTLAAAHAAADADVLDAVVDADEPEPNT